MFDVHDRRSALAKLAAGAAAAGVAVREMTTGADAQSGADAEKKKKSGGVTYFWRLPWGPAVFTKHGGGDPLRYNATVGAFGEGSFDDMKSGKKRTINDKQLERIINKKSNNGHMKGVPQIRLAGINWRVLHADYVPGTQTWQMDLKVCDSNPNARPDTTPAGVSSAGDVAVQYIDGGCSCACATNKCYVCGTSGRAACGPNCGDACGDQGCR